MNTWSNVKKYAKTTALGALGMLSALSADAQDTTLCDLVDSSFTLSQSDKTNRLAVHVHNKDLDLHEEYEAGIPQEGDDLQHRLNQGVSYIFDGQTAKGIFQDKGTVVEIYSLDPSVQLTTDTPHKDVEHESGYKGISLSIDDFANQEQDNQSLTFDVAGPTIDFTQYKQFCEQDCISASGKVQLFTAPVLKEIIEAEPEIIYKEREEPEPEQPQQEDEIVLEQTGYQNGVRVFGQAGLSASEDYVNQFTSGDNISIADQLGSQYSLGADIHKDNLRANAQYTVIDREQNFSTDKVRDVEYKQYDVDALVRIAKHFGVGAIYNREVTSTSSQGIDDAVRTENDISGQVAYMSPASDDKSVTATAHLGYSNQTNRQRGPIDLEFEKTGLTGGFGLDVRTDLGRGWNSTIDGGAKWTRVEGVISEKQGNEVYTETKLHANAELAKSIRDGRVEVYGSVGLNNFDTTSRTDLSETDTDELMYNAQGGVRIRFGN